MKKTLPRGTDELAQAETSQVETAASEWLARFKAIGHELSDHIPECGAVEQLYADRRRLDR